MSILNELYNGNICPAEKLVKKEGEYYKRLKELVDRIDRLMKKLDGEEQKLWDEIQDIQNEMEKISDKESFIDGFCIGVRMMLEILSEDRIDRTVL